MGRIGNIINKKGKQDAKRAKIFTKHARAIAVAAKEGGGNPDYNAALKTAIEKAKADNMPNDNIERAIAKGAEAGANENYEIIVELVSINDVVDIMKNIDKTLHALIQTISVPDTLKLDYLEFYFTSGIDIKYQNAELKKYYIILSCKLRKEQDLTKWVREKGLSVLDDSYLLEELQKLNNYDALYVIYHHMGKISEELICIIKCVDKLFQEKGELKVNSLNSYIMAGIDSILSMKGSKVKYWIIFISAVMKEFSQNKKKINNKREYNKNI